MYMHSTGDWQIGIYNIRKVGRKWIAFGTSWGHEENCGEYRSLKDARIALIGE